jgi:hypothetical protein
MELGVDLLQRDLLIDIVIYRILNQFVHLWLFQINSFARKKKKTLSHTGFGFMKLRASVPLC